jgi:hypothetical protein
MAFQPFLLRRHAHAITIAGTAYNVWPAVGVDYGNQGSEADPPTVSYVNEVDQTLEGPIVAALPLSAEGTEVQASAGGALPWYRHFISVRAARRWPPAA